MHRRGYFQVMLWNYLLACAEGSVVESEEEAAAEAPGIDWIPGADTGDAPPDPPEDPSESVFAEGTIHDIDLTIDDAAWKTLEAAAANVAPATMTIDGETLEVGIHRKGSSTLRGMGQKAAFSVDVGEIVPDQRWHGLHHFALNNMVLDPTMVREHVAAWMYAKLGVIAPRHSYARVRINGEAWGLYGLVDAADQRFLHHRFPDDDAGWLYDSWFNVSDLTPSADATFTVQEEGDAGAPFEDLHALVDTIAATPQGSALSLLQTRFDAEEFLLGQATEIVFGNYDAYWFNKNNYLLYHAPIADRWTMIPWGPDQSFMGNGLVTEPPHAELDVRCAQDPACEDALRAKMQVVAEAMIDLDLAAYVEQSLSEIEADCVSDPRSELPCDPSSIQSFVAQRPAFVLSQL